MNQFNANAKVFVRLEEDSETQVQVKEYLGHEGPLYAFQEVFPLKHLFGEEEKIARIKYIGQLRYFAQILQIVLLQIGVVLFADLVDSQVSST